MLEKTEENQETTDKSGENKDKRMALRYFEWVLYITFEM
jgi:hypothetical protein